MPVRSLSQAAYSLARCRLMPVIGSLRRAWSLMAWQVPLRMQYLPQSLMEISYLDIAKGRSNPAPPGATTISGPRAEAWIMS